MDCQRAIGKFNWYSVLRRFKRRTASDCTALCRAPERHECSGDKKLAVAAAGLVFGSTLAVGHRIDTAATEFDERIMVRTASSSLDEFALCLKYLVEAHPERDDDSSYGDQEIDHQWRGR